jgi:hypothetical protein
LLLVCLQLYSPHMDHAHYRYHQYQSWSYDCHCYLTMVVVLIYKKEHRGWLTNFKHMWWINYI